MSIIAIIQENQSIDNTKRYLISVSNFRNPKWLSLLLHVLSVYCLSQQKSFDKQHINGKIKR